MFQRSFETVRYVKRKTRFENSKMGVGVYEEKNPNALL